MARGYVMDIQAFTLANLIIIEHGSYVDETWSLQWSQLSNQQRICRMFGKYTVKFNMLTITELAYIPSIAVLKQPQCISALQRSPWESGQTNFSKVSMTSSKSFRATQLRQRYEEPLSFRRCKDYKNGGLISAFVGINQSVLTQSCVVEIHTYYRYAPWILHSLEDILALHLRRTSIVGRGPE